MRRRDSRSVRRRLFRVRMRRCRSPPAQYSKMRKKFASVLCTWFRETMLGCLYVCKMEISSSRFCSTFFVILSDLRLIALMATVSIIRLLSPLLLVPLSLVFDCSCSCSCSYSCS